MIRRASKSDELRETEFPEVILILFIWFAFSILCALGNSDQVGAATIGLFTSGSLLSLTTVALVMTLATSQRDLQVLTFSGYIILALLPAWAFRGLPALGTSLFDLFYVLLIATPVLYRTWGWRLQAVAGTVAVVLIGCFSLSKGVPTSMRPLFVVSAAVILSTLAAYVRRAAPSERTLEMREQALRLAAQMSRSQLPQRVWGALMLQVYLFGVLVFLDFTLRHGTEGPFLLGHVNAFLVVIFGGLLLSIVKPAYLALAMTGISMLVALTLTGTAYGQNEGTLLNVTIPLIYVCFSTAGLPWSLSYPIAIAWTAILASIGANVIAIIATTGYGLVEAVGWAVVSERGELGILVVGAVTSVVIAQLLRQRKLASVAAVVERETIDQPFAIGLERRIDTTHFASLENPTFRDLERARTRRLLIGLTCVGLCSNIIGSTAAVYGSMLLLLPAGMGWLLLVFTVTGLSYISRSDIPHRKLFQIGAFVVLLFMLWPGAFFFSIGETRSLWYLWPLCFFIGLGAIPWKLEEVIPLSAISIVAGLEIVSHLTLGAPGAVAFGVALPLGVLLATSQLRHLKEHQLLKSFHHLLEQTREEAEVGRVLGDALTSLFDANSALISLGGEHLELIRGGKCFPLLAGDWPLHKLREELEPLEFDKSGIGMRTVSWLPSHWSFFDRRFGVFSSIHGVLVELNFGRPATASGVGETSLRPTRSLLVFVGSDLPLIAALKGDELSQCRSLAGMSLLRLQTFLERRQYGMEQQHQEAAQAEREYELSTLVHDINNTVQDLTLLCDGMLDQLSDPSANGDGAKADKGMIPQLKRIGVIVRSMATVVSDAKRKRELERLQDLSPRELIEVNEVLEEILSFAAVRAERKRITVRSEGLGTEPCWIKISAREHLETIIRNLLNNAIMYSDPGSAVVVRVHSTADHVSIDVADNGPGLSAEECKAIFLSGYRGKTGAHVPGGLGVGLAQSKRVAESANGTLEVVSAGAGQGSTFTVRLPRQPVPMVMRTEKSWALMVDDQPNLTEFYARIARALHFIPVVAGSVAEAIAHLEQRGKPTFVLTDLHLGTGDGLDVIRFVRERYGMPIPILVVSGHNDQDIEERVRRAGATDFVSKPISRQALFARIQSLLPVTN